MRSARLFFLTFSLAACHRSQATPPGDTAPATAAGDAGTAGGSPFDAGDPAALSHSAETSAQIEPRLAAAGSTLAVAWTGMRPDKSSLIGARISRDLGRSWSEVQALSSPDGRSASDAAIGVSPRGDVFLAWLAFQPDAIDGTPRDTHVFVAHADPSATTFGPPIDLTEHMHRGSTMQMPWLAMTSAGTALVTWKYGAEGANGIGITRGDAEGKWVAGKVIERFGLQAWVPTVCASSHGDRVWVAYIDADAGVRVRASDDGAASWSPSRATTVSPADEKSRLAIDPPVCAGDLDDVAVVYGHTKEVRDDARTQGLDSIVVARSFDGGRTYDWRRTIELGADSVATHPQVVREADGAIDVAYYTASVADGGADVGSLKLVHIESGGAVSPPRVVRDHVRVARARKSPSWPGDAFGLAWHEGKIYTASVDATSDVPHVAFSVVPAK